MVKRFWAESERRMSANLVTLRGNVWEADSEDNDGGQCYELTVCCRENKCEYEVAYDKAQLKDLLSSNLKPMKIIGDSASESLVKSIAEFIDE